MSNIYVKIPAASTSQKKPGMSTIYLAPKDWFLALQNPSAVTPGPNNGGLAYTVSAAHTFKTPATVVSLMTTWATTLGWIKMDATVNGNELEGKSVGEPGSKTPEWMVKGFVAGLSANLIEFFDRSMNDDWIAIIKNSDCQNPEFYQVGCDCFPATLDWNFKSGTVKGGKKGFEFTLTSNCSALRYTATLPILT